MNAQFEQLNNLLLRHRHWWQFRAFHCIDYPWQNPALNQALDDLSDQELEYLKGNPEDLALFLSPWIDGIESLNALLRLPKQGAIAPYLPEGLKRFIPGNKLQQIVAMAQTVPEHSPVLEWCAGKSHLGRVLAYQNHAVQAVEINQSLCDDGKRLAGLVNADIEFICADVLQDDLSNAFNGETFAIALHACGDLHQRLILSGSQFYGLSIAPCCYHLTEDEYYQPLSPQGLLSSLQLDKQDLSLCLQETVTACKKMPVLNDKEVQWRLAFDSLQRQLRAADEYLPLPTIKKSQLKKSFPAFLLWAFEQKNLLLPQGIDDEYWLLQGAARLKKVRRMELVQQLFKRPIEQWLLMDKSLYLVEQGFDVNLFEFCDKKISPRNICIQALRKTA